MSESINLPKIRIFLDSASVEEIDYHYRNHTEYISGFTTNPTLMKNAGVKDYLEFVKNTINKINDLPISFEVFADEIDEMKRQAMELAEISSNVCVKIPITNTRGVSTHGLISELNNQGVFCNVTAIMTIEQIKIIQDSLMSKNPIILSVFAGRIADTGRDPLPILKEICVSVNSFKQISILWASTRELYNIFQAEQAGCQIITVTAPLLKKLDGLGKNLEMLSLETVEMFYRDAKSAGYTI
jgi:transaldolase